MQHDENSTARIFLDKGGFAGWFAYFIAKNGANVRSHFSEKADCGRLVAKLECEPTVSRGLLAVQVASAIQPEVKQKINGLYDRRIRTLQDDDMSQRPNKRPRTAKSDLTATLPSGGSRPSAIDQAPVYPIVNSSNYLAEDQHVLVNASLAEATILFPRDLSNAIKRNPCPRQENTLVAAISMTFPNTPFTNNIECQMAIEITDDKVPHFARELFGIRLETRAGLRYVCLAAGGSKILPNPKFTLQGCQRNIIASTFGPEPATAITTNSMYQEDVRQCRDCTDSVSMVVSHQADEGAVIYVSLGLWEGTQIRKKLYV